MKNGDFPYSYVSLPKGNQPTILYQVYNICTHMFDD